MLYHGSAVDIHQFAPRDGISNAKRPYHGTLATTEKKMAMLYALKIKEGFDSAHIATGIGAAKDADGVDPRDFMITNQNINGVPTAIIRDRKKFLEALENNGGGYLYRMPNETFAHIERDDGKPSYEWCSESLALVPGSQERVTLENVLQNGCQVLFLKDGMDFNGFMKEFGPRIQEFDEGDRHVALYKEYIKKGILIDENAARGIPNALNLSDTNIAPPSEMKWSTQPRNQPGLRSDRPR